MRPISNLPGFVMLTKIAISYEARRDFCPIFRFFGKLRRDFAGFPDVVAKCVAILPDFLISRQRASRFCRISNFAPKFDASGFESVWVR